MGSSSHDTQSVRKKTFNYIIYFWQIVKSENNQFAAVFKLLSDYTKNESVVGRFFSGAWNRHHVSEISKILGSMKKGQFNHMNDLIERLDKIELKNKSGELAHIIQFIKANYSTNVSVCALPEDMTFSRTTSWFFGR